MANKVTIDVEARFVDNLTDESKAASKSVREIGTEAEKAEKKVNNLGNKKANPSFDANDSKFLKKIKSSESRIAKFARSKASAFLDATDKASQKVQNVLSKVKNFAGRTFSAMVKIKDSDAMKGLEGIISQSKSIAGKTWSAMVKIKDMATSPLKKIKESLFSIKSLVMAITAGFAAKKFVMDPISLADSYSSAKIGFSTLLGDDAGQKMMDDLDAFAKATPFKTSEVIANSQKMIAMGWQAEDIISDMKTIGDAAAATGKGDEGLNRIVLALSQIKSKGKLSTEELNQLAEAGISAKRYLAEGLGYGSGDSALQKMAKDLEGGKIGADTAIKAIMQGMKEYNGMMEKTANETVEGLKSQIEDTFEINILRRWGQGLQDGAKKGLGSIVSLLDNADESLAAFGDTVYEVGKTISNWAADKLEKTVKTINKITASDEFKNASLGGKIKMLWDGAIGNPFSKWWGDTVVPWWNGTAIPWLQEKAAKMGKSIGEGLTNGLLALFGQSDTLVDGAEQGASVARSFVEGFTEGFDGSAVTQAITNAFLDVWDALPWWAKGILIGKGVGKVVGGVNSIVGGAQTFGGNMATLWGTPGTAMFAGKGLSSGLASIGYSLTGGAAGSALSGGAAAAIGGGSVLGGILGGSGIISGIKNIYQGTQTTGKEAQDKYFQGGTKIGMVGTGAAAGAAIGSVVPVVGTAAGALIGAGVGGAGALFGGEKAGKWLSDKKDSVTNWIKKKYYGNAYDEESGQVDMGWIGETGGWLDKVKELKTFFTETLPEKFGELCDTVGEFFTETIPDAVERVGEKISTFFTETVPEKWGEFWEMVGTFFSEQLPFALGYITGKIYTFFSETVPEFFENLWDSISTFFTETLPDWAEGIWNDHIYPFFTETIPGFFASLWSAITTFFTETLPEWAEGIWNDHIYPFFTETIPGFFASLWNAISTFFTETLPEWAEWIWNDHIYPFFTETIPNFFSSLWDSVTGLFESAVDAIAENIWEPIKTFFTDTIPGWVSSAIGKVKEWWSSVKENFLSGFSAGSGGDGGGKARGGIVGGPTAMQAFARGGIVGGSTRFIRVNEESPEMIIPLSSQRRDRAMKLWEKTGEIIGAPGFATGGLTAPVSDIRDKDRPGDQKVATEATVIGGGDIRVDIGGIEIKVDAAGGDVLSAIRAQKDAIAEEIAGIIVESLSAQFATTPLRGGLA